MNRVVASSVLVLIFGAGVLTPLLYQRWNPTESGFNNKSDETRPVTGADYVPGRSYPVSFVPLSAPLPREATLELPVLAARDIEKIRRLTGQDAKIRGRIFRVGHSAKSNTYFLNFGPSREALTAVIFASAAELFEKSKLAPKNYENREVEITGTVKDHPQFGVEIILEHPKQIKFVD